jgi:hypothetical protein
MSRRFSALGGLQLTEGISFWASRTGVDIRSNVSNMSLAVELMIPLSLVVDDGDGEGAGEGVAAADEPLLEDDSSKIGLWCSFLDDKAAAAYGLAAINLLFL